MQCRGFCNDKRRFVDPANVNFIFIHNVLEVHEPFYVLTFTASEHTQGRGLKVSFVKDYEFCCLRPFRICFCG